MSEIFQKYKWTVLAGDFNSPFIRNYTLVKGLLRYPELFGVPRPVLGIVSKENAIEYISDLTAWTKTHEAMKGLVEKDNQFVEKLIDRTNELGEIFNEWSEKNIFKTDLQKLSNENIASLLKDFVEKQGEMYAYGSALPILDFGDFSFVEDNLKKILKERLSETEYEKYFEILTEPLHNSFAQDQEEDLLLMMSKFYADENWKKDVNQKPLTEIKAEHPEFYEALQRHTSKHAWVYYVYVGPAYTEKDFLEFIKDYLHKGVNPEEKLEQIKSKRQEVASLREKYIENLKPNEFERMILKLVGKLVWAKPRRKDYQSKSYYHLEKLLREIARRLSISVSQARSMPIDLLAASLEKSEIDLSLINSIYKIHACLPDENEGVLVLSDEKANDFFNKYIESEKSEDMKDVKEIKGTVAYKGKVTGKVKVINLPADMIKMQDGDILVSLATTPSIVPAMKKAAAIVTDEGGLTCHASIVSRELGITCVVGTKFASKILKDGDMIEVDAIAGIVRILK